MVVGAKHVSLSCMALPDDAWRFKGVVPPEHQSVHHRRWYIRESTQRVTLRENAMVPPSGEGTLPSGTSLWHASDQSKRLIALATHDARMLFDEQISTQTLPGSNEWTVSGHFTLFSLPGPRQLLLGDCHRLLSPHAPYVARLMAEYARSICWMFNIEASQFDKSCRVHITCFPPGGGSPMRLAECSECPHENGPVIHVGIGAPLITHDLSPTLSDHDNESPVRLSVPEGVMVCLDGETRMCFSHGHPTLHGAEALLPSRRWFVLTFFLDCTESSVPVGYETHTGALVMQTPVHPDRVVPHTRVDPPPRQMKPNPVDSLINRMGARLRQAESHALAHTYWAP